MVETPSSESSPNGGNNNKDNNYYLVILDLREELAQSKIVEYFGIDLRTNNIRIKLNGKYNHNSVISSFDLKDWRTTVNNLKTGLAEKDIDPIDIKNISNTFDDNNTKLTEAYFNAVKSQEEENKRRAKEAAEEAEKEAKAASSFDDDLEMIKGNIVQTFVEETSRTVARVRIDEHVENRFMDDGVFRQWIGTTYFKHAEEIRLQAIESDDEYIPSVAASILSDDDKTKIQTILMYEALGETYQRDKEYEQGFLADHRDGFEIDLRAICSKIDKSKDPDIFKPREKARIRLGLRCDARISYDHKAWSTVNPKHCRIAFTIQAL
jgi:hypothetical protein